MKSSEGLLSQNEMRSELVVLASSPAVDDLGPGAAALSAADKGQSPRAHCRRDASGKLPGIDFFTDDVLQQMRAHAKSGAGEVCGFVYQDHYQPLTNIFNSRERFYADPAEIARALSRYGEPPAIFHSHPCGSLELSAIDRKLWYYPNSTMIVGCIRDGHLHWKMYGNRGD